MASAVLASLVAGLAWALLEAFGRFYPSLLTWRRLRVARGNAAVRLMRRRFETAAERPTPRRLAIILIVLATAWVAVAGLLDKRWYEVALDVTPYLIASVALLRTRSILSRIANRMRKYEHDAGWDLEDGEEDEGPEAVALA